MRILSFGEILWDCFGEIHKIGGAPFNFSAHLSKLGADVNMISAVGDDNFGREALKKAREYGIAEEFIAFSSHPTGVCLVSDGPDGNPFYDLKEDMAYDNIIFDSFEKLRNFDLFYFGTLAVRNEASKKTLENIIAQCSFKEVFCDINIRQHYYNRDTIENCLRSCTILKVSQEEFHIFHELGFLGSENDSIAAEENYFYKSCKILAEKYKINILIITLGKNGAILYNNTNKNMIFSKKPINPLVSAVGAGDSFSACFVYNYLNGQNLQDCIDRSVELSDYVVTKLEAVPDYPDGLLERINKIQKEK